MRNPVGTLAGLLLVPLLFAVPAPAAEKQQADRVDPTTVGEWLVLGPMPHPLPVFFDEAGEPELEHLLGEDPFAGDWPRPAEGRTVTWFGGTELDWVSTAADKRGKVVLTLPEGASAALPHLALLASYVTVDRWIEVGITIHGTTAACAWIDGDRVVDCELEPGEGDKKGGAIEGETELAPGSHLLIVQTVRPPNHEGPWTSGVEIAPRGEEPAVVISSSVSRRDLGIREILDAPTVGTVALAPDGRHVALTVSRFVPGTDDAESRVEIREVPGGRLVESRRQESAGSVGWSDDGRYVSWLDTEDGEATLVLLDRETGRAFPLLDEVEGLAGYAWSPKGKAIVYWTTETAESDERGVKRLESLMDRWATHRDKQFLHQVTVPDGVTRRLTAGDLTTSAGSFSPDGGRMLFYRDVEDLTQRPYSLRELWEMDLETLEAVKLRDLRWGGGASYAPDGGRLLIAAQPEEFGATGENVADHVVTNSYDSQLFLWDPDTGEVDAITREFDPAVVEARWSYHDGRIYLVADQADRRLLYRYDLVTREFKPMDRGLDYLSAFALARQAPTAIVVGSSAWKPESLVALDLESGRRHRSAHPGDDFFAGVPMGTVEHWSFTASSGSTVDGRVYLPPGFDPAQRYPAIVYYYGGVSPTSREFGGRYPKEWWAARGYVVYVLQPSGAVGFGQPFSALHVNDWGIRTSREVIEGTTKFLEAHPFVDPERVGCIGASFGGFMTMLLSTQTDLFATAVSHAGISSIASYWGEGYWGYTYNSVAAAGSFPWNRKDIYVEQSPLFRADQARVPILLTHGRSDTNVPVGESDAFYVALKLLGKEVEYVQVEGQDHWILDHDKRIVWSSTILAWFDRWLKGQPEWWGDLY
jgi:dipeptidyl aminopeptidase/acylaminoacyl peptidase